MLIEVDRPSRKDVRALLAEHLRDMLAASPAVNVHAPDVARLEVPAVTFWSAREDGRLLGCGALKALDDRHGEIKSMRTTPAARRAGVAAAVLEVIVQTALARTIGD